MFSRRLLAVLLAVLAGVFAPVVASPLAEAAESRVGADRFNEVFSRKSLSGWLGGDVAISTTTKPDNSWWFFGDTLLGSKGRTKHAIASSALFVDGSRALRVKHVGPGGRKRHSLLPASGRVKFWPSAALNHPSAAGDVLLSAAKVEAHGLGQWDFRVTGAKIFRLRLTEGARGPKSQITGAYSVPQPKDLGVIQWGSAMLIDEGVLSVFGTRAPAHSKSWGKEVFLAQSELDASGAPAEWAFSDGAGGLVSDVNSAKPVINAEADLPHVFSVVHHPAGRGFLLVAKAGEGAGRWVVGAASADLAGPWGGFVNLFDASPTPGVWSYMAVAHPALESGSPGGMVVSVSRNAIGKNAIERLRSSPTIYRPRFVDVPSNLLPRP